MKIKKKSEFLQVPNFKLLSQMKGNSVKVICLKLIISGRGWHCDYPLTARNSPATQLIRRESVSEQS
jgi:hypothetical protein